MKTCKNIFLILSILFSAICFAEVKFIDTSILSIDLSSDASGVLPLVNGGTEKALTALNGGICYSDADSLELSLAGISGQALVSGGAGTPTFFAPTLGSVIFAGTSGILQQDSTNFFWDDTNNRLGIGINAPLTTLQVKANTPGTVGDFPGGQIIIQALGTSANANAVITGYNSDGSGNPNNQLWYLGSSSGSNSNITLLNRIAAASLSLGTNSLTRLTIAGDGSVGIGVTDPDAPLEINGQIKITGGVPGANKILTSDANGLASWVTGLSATDITTGTLVDAQLETTIDRTIFNASDFITALGGLHVGGTADPAGELQLTSVLDPELTIISTETSADGNEAGQITFNAQGSVAAQDYVTITAIVDDETDAIEESTIELQTMSVGVLAARISINGANVTHDGFTKLGSAAPLIKHAKLTGTGGTAEGWTTNVAHGLGDIGKMISATVLLTAPNGNLIPPSFTDVAEFQYDFLVTSTNFVVTATTTNSGSILASSSFVILLTLEE